MTTARTVLPRLLLVQLAACFAHAVELPLLEASGAAAGLVVVAGNFTNGTNGVLLQEGKAGAAAPVVLTLAGPTPHVQGRLYPFKGGPPLAGTARPPPGPRFHAICASSRASTKRAGCRWRTLGRRAQRRRAHCQSMAPWISGALAALSCSPRNRRPPSSPPPFNFVVPARGSALDPQEQPTSVSRPCLDLRGKRSAPAQRLASLWPCATTIHTTLCSSRPLRPASVAQLRALRASVARRSSGWRSQTCTATGRRMWS